ncbi:homoserine kinase [Neisseria shayeganii 871]|uniref:Homoserine kinase n=1 Tax=Neisseria shayeganii 871 TaxID=1032488 RepID=G4CJQ4_9NEIS|nr:homoserine kinase [Neisseria shayeganii 871]
MSVYTSVSDSELRIFLEDYDLGGLVSLQGIAQGVTNSNYFLTTERGRFVLTIFEALTQEELPFFLELKQHLSRHGVACPAPVARRDGRFDGTLAGKPACLVSCLNGRDTAVPDAAQCFHTGAMLAQMHLAGQSFPQHMANPRHAAWWQRESVRLLPCLDAEDAALLQDEIAFLAAHPDDHLPHGIIHADLFKDNVLLNGHQVAGFIDFYYACRGSFVYDIAIAVNDWARLADNRLSPKLQQAFMDGYQSVRPLSEAEATYLPLAHRAGCIRFWVSRLLDYHFPQGGEMTFIKDPNVFRDLLLAFRDEDAGGAVTAEAADLDGKIFRTICNADNGEVGGDTRFHYRQQGEMIWAEYAGGEIRKGFLIGRMSTADTFEFTYQHLNRAWQSRSGRCRSRIERQADGRLRLYESWQWTDGSGSGGESVLEECR